MNVVLARSREPIFFTIRASIPNTLFILMPMNHRYRNRKTCNGLLLRFTIVVNCMIMISFPASGQPQEGTPLRYDHPIPFKPATYICYRAQEQISIDGRADENDWENAAWSDPFVDIEGNLKPKPPLRTNMKMLWDDRYLYVYARLEEPHVWATLRQRDTVIFYDDDFEIFIDPDGDSHGYYELEANAYNTLWDLILLRPYRTDHDPKVLNEWNVTGIRTAVHVEGTINDPAEKDSYWAIEWAIPWSALSELAPGNGPPGNGEQWRINFSRVDWEMDHSGSTYKKKTHPDTGRPLPENNWVWSPTGRINMHMPEMWGYVQFSDIAAGTGKTQFNASPDEEIKWGLWQLYFQQRAYYEKHGSFTNTLEQFTVPDISLPGCPFEPWIYTTPHLFEITNRACDHEGTWSIRQDGKIQLR